MRRSAWLFIAILLPTLLMLPVLIWPHFGLFSDADQIITFPKIFFGNFAEGLPRLLHPADDGRWNPLFHGLTLFIYALSPGSSRIFYLAQWLMFVLTCISLGWIVRRITDGQGWAILGIALFCTASSVFESFYTLDKIEPRITFFAAVILWLLVDRLLGSRYINLLSGRWIFFTLQLFFGIMLIFSKETGIYVGVAILLTWVACLMNPQWGNTPRSILRTSWLIQGSIFIAFILLFKALLIGGDGRYTNYSVSFTIIQANLTYYLGSSPELLLGLICAVFWCLGIVSKRLQIRSSQTQIIGILFSVMLITYFAGMAIWRWPLDYYLLPAHFLCAALVPISLYCATQHINVAKYKISIRIGVAIAGVVWIIFLIMRIFTGFFVYQQDALKDDLARYLADPKWDNRRFILTFTHPESLEVGQRLKFFFDRERQANNTKEVFNFWEPPGQNRQNSNRFVGSAGEVPSDMQLKEVAKLSGPVIWQYGSGSSTKNTLISGSWGYSPLGVNDVFLLPISNQVPYWIKARGLGMYQMNFNDEGLGLKLIGSIERRLGSFLLGWRIFQVEQITNDGK